MSEPAPLIRWFSDLDRSDTASVGGKNSSLSFLAVKQVIAQAEQEHASEAGSPGKKARGPDEGHNRFMNRPGR